PDGLAGARAYSEIWDHELYRFRADTQAPLIIDGRAGVGMSVIYFKRLFPRCRLLAFEPEPDAFKILAGNCQRFQLQGVELFCEALGAGGKDMGIGKDAPEMAGKGSGTLGLVRTDRLRELLSQEVDLLKLDIDGAPIESLSACADLLRNVKNLFLEYTWRSSETDALDAIE